MRKILLTAGLILATLLILFGCTQTTNQETIKIGFIGVLSGDGSSWGEAAKNGVALAVSKINASGGINGKNIEVSYQDDQSTPEKAVSAFKQLVENEGIHFIIGTTWSRTGIPLVDLAAEDKVVMISPSLGKAEFNEANKYLFNTWPHDKVLSSNLADYVYNKGIRRVAVIGAEEIWVKEQTTAFTQRFTELGGQIIVTVEPDPNNKDPSTDALKIKDANRAEAIITTTDGMLIGTIVARKTRELGNTLPIYSISVDQSTVDASKGAYEGMEFLTFLTPTKDFQEKYETTYGKNMDIGADTAYDAVMMLAKAMRDTNSNEPDTVAQYLAEITNYSGASGELTSDGNRAFTKAFVVKKIINGKISDLN